MGTVISLLVPFASALVLSYLVTPLVITMAYRAKVLDVPTDARRAHSVPIPRLGGIALLTGVAAAWGGTWATTVNSWSPFGSAYENLWPGFIFGSGLIFLAGLIDDFRGLSPRLKLFFQVCAALSVISYGLLPNEIALAPNEAIGRTNIIGGVIILTFWIVGITNAFNLIDGLDGLASTSTLLSLACIVASGSLLKGGMSPAVPLAVAGAIIGFLRYNWNPARIFLGDAGSMTLGFIVAVLSVIAATDVRGVAYPAIPLFAAAFPITDTIVAIARRWIRGVPYSVADGRHIHHQLRIIGLSVPQTVKVLGLTFSLIAAMGFVFVFTPAKFSNIAMIGSLSVVFAIMVQSLQWLKYDEFFEFGSSLYSVLRSARRIAQLNIYISEAQLNISRASSEGSVREALNTLADKVGLLDIELIFPGERESLLPPSRHINQVDALPMRSDYFISVGGSLTSRLIVRAWTVPTDTVRHHVAERTVLRIGPAVKHWYHRHLTGLSQQHANASQSRDRTVSP